MKVDARCQRVLTRGAAFRRTRCASSARLELALLDPQLRRKVRIVAADLLDEAFGLLAADSSRITSRKWPWGQTMHGVRRRVTSGRPHSHVLGDW